VAAIKRTLAGTDLPATLPAETRAALQAAISAAFAVTFRLLMLGAAGLALLAALCALATIPGERLSNPR
jgi:NAD(P)H-hydrate repair Nnr-like enzyme with NAD(P)H-hydrate epimerase domain